MKNNQTYYALQRRSDGAWLTAEYPRLRTAKAPFLIKRLETARRHRIRGLIDQTTQHGDIDIQTIHLSLTLGEALAEDHRVQQRLSQLLTVLIQTDQAWHQSRNFRSWLETILTRTETLMQDAQAMTMQYLAYLSRSDDVNDPTGLSIHDMSRLAQFLHEDGVFLIQDDTALVALRLCDGFRPDFIYRFDTKEITQC